MWREEGNKNKAQHGGGGLTSRATEDERTGSVLLGWGGKGFRRRTKKEFARNSLSHRAYWSHPTLWGNNK